MRRRRTDPVLQEVRRLARAGRRREAVAILENALQQHPGHAKAKEELARYLMGKPFSFEEVDYQELRSIITSFISSPQKVSRLNRKLLKGQQHRALYLEKALEHLLSADDKRVLQQMHAAYSRSLQKHRRPLGRIAVMATATLLLLSIAAGAGIILYNRSVKAADILSAAASSSTSRDKALELLQVYNTGLNRTLNRRVGEQAEKLEARFLSMEQQAREIESSIRKIEQGKHSVVDIGVHKRALIESRLRGFGPNFKDLQSRWAELCRREQAALNQQRLSLVEELMAPLPEKEALQGSPAEDLTRLKQRMKRLQLRQHIYEDASAALELPHSIIEPALQEISETGKIIAELTAFQKILELLPTVRDYDQYQALLRDFKPELYHPAVEIMQIRPMLPTVANIQGMMQEHGQDLPPGLLQAARDSLVEGRPTFSARFPATREQLHLLDELQSNSALNTRLFELTNTVDNLQAYSEELPVLKYGRACFNRSSLDPMRDLAERKYVEWQNPHSVVSRTLDPRSLYKALGLDNRTGFSTSVNLPAVLTRLLQHENPEVPPLAKAYVFKYLLDVNNSGSQNILSGLRFAPEMRTTVDSFRELEKECHIKLDGNCWLLRTPEHARAERKFARWFSKHRKTDFAGELRNNLEKILKVEPRFCGYINERGTPVLFAQPSQGQLIWYLSGTSMTTTPWGGDLQNPARFSPVFTMGKVY